MTLFPVFIYKIDMFPWLNKMKNLKKHFFVSDFFMRTVSPRFYKSVSCSMVEQTKDRKKSPTLQVILYFFPSEWIWTKRHLNLRPKLRNKKVLPQFIFQYCIKWRKNSPQLLCVAFSNIIFNIFQRWCVPVKLISHSKIRFKWLTQLLHLEPTQPKHF